MSSTSATTANTPKSTAKGAKRSRIVKLRLSPDTLAQFPSDSKTPSSSSSSIKNEPSPSVQPPDNADKTSESNATPIPPVDHADNDDNTLTVPEADNKRKKVITGRKRAPPAIDPTVPPRERARPGPKKKPRLPDGTIDHTSDGKKGPFAGPNPVSTHKLGPKANTGAINAGLRALDRSGKPCRRWHRKTLALKSFTGTEWIMPSWKAPVRESSFSGDVKSDTSGSSEIKPNGSSALPSEMGNGDVDMTNGIESSPAPRVAAAS